MVNGIPQEAPAAPEPAQESRKPYEWDRTIAEDAERAEAERIRKTPFPLPKAKVLVFDKGFCDYWNDLITRPESRYARLFVRRWFPALLPDEKEDAITGLKRETYPSEKTLTASDGPLSEQKLLDAVGVGDYTIRLNDTRRPFDQATIVHCEKFCTMRDYDHYPPVFDISRLDWDDESNQVYIKFAQARGILPRERDREKEQFDMANVAAIDSVLEDSRRERARADQIQREALDRAERDAKEAKAREEAAKELAAKTAEAAKNQVQPKSGAAAELESVGAVILNLATAIRPEKDNSLAEYLKLQAEREKTEREREKEERQAAREAAAAERKRADDLQQQLLDDARSNAKAAAQSATSTVAPVAAKTDVDLLEEMVKKQSLMKQLTGRGGNQEEEARPSNIDKWLEAAPLVAPVVQSLLGGIFQTIQHGFQTWQTISYNNALKNGTPQPPIVMNQQQQQQAPPPGQPAPAQGPPPTAEQQQAHQRLVTMLKALEDAAMPILIAFSKGESGDSISAGATFADNVISYKGRPDYDLIRSMGEKTPGVFDLEVFTNNVRALLNHPGRGPNTANLASNVISKPSFGQFLSGFFNYDKIQEELQTQADTEERS